MLNKKVIAYVLVPTIIFCAGFVLMKIRTDKGRAPVSNSDCYSYVNLVNTIKLEGIIFPYFVALTENRNDSINFLELPFQDKVFFYSSGRGCSVCQDLVIEMLLNLPSNDQDKIIIISSEENYRQYLIEKNKLGLYFEMYHARYENLGHEFQEFDNCFFTVNNNLEIRDLFIPDKSVPELTDIYLKSKRINITK